MSEQLKIKLSIANRVYPLTIPPSQEEGLRKAAKKIEAMIKAIELNSGKGKHCGSTGEGGTGVEGTDEGGM